MRKLPLNQVEAALDCKHFSQRPIEVKPIAKAVGKFIWQWKLVFALCFVGLSWLAIPYYYPNDVATWIDNETLPKAGIWILTFAVISIVKRRSLLKNSTVPGRLHWVALGIAMLLLSWIRPWHSPHIAYYWHIGSSSIFIYGCGGRTWLRVVLPALIILLLFPGLPSTAYDSVVSVLQDFQVQCASLFCRIVLSINGIRYENCILLPFAGNLTGSGSLAAFSVLEDCSGYRSLFGMTLLSILWGSHLGLSIQG